MIIENGDEIATSVTTRKIKRTLIAHANPYKIISYRSVFMGRGDTEVDSSNNIIIIPSSTLFTHIHTHTISGQIVVNSPYNPPTSRTGVAACYRRCMMVVNASTNNIFYVADDR